MGSFSQYRDLTKSPIVASLGAAKDLLKDLLASLGTVRVHRLPIPHEYFVCASSPMKQERIRSPLPWMGGKFHLAKRILASFPPVGAYDLYVEPFGGAAHVLVQKPPSDHLEVFNDINDDLVNFWLNMRDHATRMQERLGSLPYARSVYYAYHKSLYDGTPMDTLERAVRWFYVLRSSFLPEVKNVPSGWSISSRKKDSSKGKSYHNVLQVFACLTKRFRSVEIENRDFAPIITQRQSPRTLLYVDPPYIGVEQYYQYSFTLDDHKRLAVLLNQTQSYVALSYYPHPLLDSLYPSSHWRRVSFHTNKHSQRTKKTHDRTQELLLMNY